MKTAYKENAVSPVVGIVFLIAIVVVLSTLVFTTTGGILTEQQAPSAGANVNIVSESVIQVQLDSVQNADNVYVQSPLGTRYELESVGDTEKILNIGNQQKPVIIAEKDGKEHVVQGITPRSFDADYVVDEGNSFSDALTAASPGDTIAVKRGTYSTNLNVDKDVKIVSEYGTTLNGGVTVSSTTTDATVSNMDVSGDVTVEGNNTYMASNKIEGNLSTTYSTKIVSNSNNLLRTTDDETNTKTSDTGPTASFTIPTTEPKLGESISFDASSSSPSDSDGSIESYEWDFTSDGTVDATGKNTSNTFSTPGTVNVTLTVTDDDGKQGETTKTVKFSNESPNASYTASSTVVQSGVPVELDASASSDPEGHSLSYTWEFSDGSTATGGVVEHSFDGDGQKTATLTVTDEYGASSTQSKTFKATTDCKTFDSNTVLSAGTHNYACVVVESGVTVTTRGDPSEDGPGSYGGVKIKSHGDIIVNGTLNGNSQGYPAEEGPGVSGGKSGGSYGGKGYNAENDAKYGSAGDANRLGSGGYDREYPADAAASGPGGGSVWLVSENGEVNVEGNIEMDSSQGYTHGGSGGSIRIEAPNVTGSGTLSAAGRRSSSAHHRGGGGRILIDTSSNGNNYNFNIDIHGYENGTVNKSPVITDIEPAAEIGSTGYSSSFTPHYNDPDGDSVSLHWDFGDGATSTAKTPGHVYTETGTYTITLTVTDEHGVSSTYTEEYTVENVGSCTVFESNTTLSAGTHEYPCVKITSGTTVRTLGDPSADEAGSYGGVKIKSQGDIIVNGTLNGNSQGYPAEEGPGVSGGRSGGSYGGLGYDAYSYALYGSAGQANRLGSGGSDYKYPASSAAQGPGGGSVWLVSENGKVSVDGRIEMDSAQGYTHGGSGGSIRIEAPEVTGNGTLSAAGRRSSSAHHRGGGGRILIDVGNSRSYNFDIDVSGYNSGTVAER